MMIKNKMLCKEIFAKIGRTLINSIIRYKDEPKIPAIESAKSLRPGRNFVENAVDYLDIEDRINEFFNAYVEYLDMHKVSDPYVAARQNIESILLRKKRDADKNADKYRNRLIRGKKIYEEDIKKAREFDILYARLAAWKNAVPELFIEYDGGNKKNGIL